jgi:hypothetical protein
MTGGRTDRPEAQRALTKRSLLICLIMVLMWTGLICFMAIHETLYRYLFIMVLGFGAIMNIFLLKFPRFFVVTLLVLWVITALMMYTNAAPDQHARLLAGNLRALPLLAILLGLGLYLHRRPLSRPELAAVFAAVVITVPWAVSIKACLESSVSNLFESTRRAEEKVFQWAKDLPWWGPTVATDGEDLTAESEAAVEGFRVGNGGRVPWRMWWRPVLYWTAVCVCFEAMLMGLLLMLRKRWIEHERLPFTWAEPALGVIRADDRPMVWRRWAVFAAGLVMCLPATYYAAGEAAATLPIPMLPWAGNEGVLGGFDLTHINVLPKVQLKLFWGPMVLAMFLLFPADVLMTVAFTYILVSLLAPSLFSWLGLDVGRQRWEDFVKWGIRSGGCAGLFIWSVWFNRRTIWGYLRSLWGRPPTDPESDDELGRWWIAAAMILGTVGFVWLACYATSLAQMLFMLLIILFYCIAQTRQRAEGMLATYENNIASHQMVSIQRHLLHDHPSISTLPGYEHLATSGNSWGIHWLQWGFCGQLKTYGPHNMLLEAFKVGHEVRAHARDIAKIVFLSMAIVAIITGPLYLKFMYSYGFENSYERAPTIYQAFTNWSERAISYGVRSTSHVYYYPSATSLYQKYEGLFNLAWGIGLTGLLFYLRREFSWFPLSPVGFVIAAETWSHNRLMFSPSQLWFSFLVAWMIKAMIFKWLGVRYFRERIQPAMVMLLCGMIFGIVVFIAKHVAMGKGFLL